MSLITLSAFDGISLHNGVNRSGLQGAQIPTPEAASITVRGKRTYYGQKNYPTITAQFVWQESTAAALANAHAALRAKVGVAGTLTGLTVGGGTQTCTAVLEVVEALDVDQVSSTLGIVTVRLGQTGDWA